MTNPETPKSIEPRSPKPERLKETVADQYERLAEKLAGNNLTSITPARCKDVGITEAKNINFTIGKDAASLSEGLMRQLFPQVKTWRQLETKQQLFITQLILIVAKNREAISPYKDVNIANQGDLWNFTIDPGNSDMHYEYIPAWGKDRGKPEFGRLADSAFERRGKISRGQREMLKIASSSMDLTSLLRIFQDNVSFDARKAILQDDKLSVEFINRYLDLFHEVFNVNSNLTDSAKLEDGAANYTSTGLQNLAWVLVLKEALNGTGPNPEDPADVSAFKASLKQNPNIRAALHGIGAFGEVKVPEAAVDAEEDNEVPLGFRPEIRMTEQDLNTPPRVFVTEKSL